MGLRSHVSVKAASIPFLFIVTAAPFLHAIPKPVGFMLCRVVSEIRWPSAMTSTAICIPQFISLRHDELPLTDNGAISVAQKLLFVAETVPELQSMLIPAQTDGFVQNGVHFMCPLFITTCCRGQLAVNEDDCGVIMIDTEARAMCSRPPVSLPVRPVIVPDMLDINISFYGMQNKMRDQNNEQYENRS
jgi:hypothetical protein